MLLFSATILTSCAEEGADDLVGQWRGVSVVYEYLDDDYEYEYNINDELFVFKSNGRFQSYYKVSGEWEFDEMGTYTYKNKKLTFLFDEDEDDPETFVVKSLTSDKLILQYTDEYDDYRETITLRKVNIDLD